ncbi:hypothetical protein MTX26_19070 [Bradyrhizobium sp. ISRA443]|uniref:hypothetical protein n=1 Tax=unclassified Bradyrhizobium TaxID=2631580 RepID=UPI00247A06CA|nr:MULTISPECIES: hypothetical protein [unclassified Bradyrhizobium]WGR92256.1 hypothetical protein MTX20_29730 [Bradyrhizobium sp. ISRA435]WGR96569.1 hypothetical protein MTX23_19070 [Bradyrhizobium sp. ISRA436]WGS03456.1 hypothetical protein MTX18_19070 [Bradyrhizobium sp. ISRA437]WGS10340.1 hypothetical protein MTX26_19070 [Bradyrhizobium sp. ISRA443]
MPIDRMMRGLGAAVLLASMAALGGCSSTVADLPGIGVPADASARPKDASGYLPVHDLPPDRNEETMKPADQAKLEAELKAARDRQATAAAQNAAAASDVAAANIAAGK